MVVKSIKCIACYKFFQINQDKMTFFLNETKWVNLFNSSIDLTAKGIIIHGDYFIIFKCKIILNTV